MECDGRSVLSQGVFSMSNILINHCVSPCKAGLYSLPRVGKPQPFSPYKKQSPGNVTLKQTSELLVDIYVNRLLLNMP